MELDDDLKKEVSQKLSGQKRQRSSRTGDEAFDLEQELFPNPDGDEKRERNKDKQRQEALKKSYAQDKQNQSKKRFKGSSYLTPESVAYLNEAIAKSATHKLDEEMIYAGLHNELKGGPKFKRNEKNKQRFKGRRKGSQKKRKNRHAQ